MLQSTNNTIYFKALHLDNVKCFKNTYTINFTDKDKNPNQWSVIIGNNNTGKTTLLKLVAGLQPKSVGNLVKDTEVNDDHRVAYVPTGFFYRGEIFGDSSGHVRAEFTIPLNKIYKDFVDSYYYSNESAGIAKNSEITDLIICSYGTSRRTASTSFNKSEINDPLEDLINDKTELINTEEWLLQTDYAVKNGSAFAKKVYKNIEDVLIKSHILPDIRNIRFTTDEHLKSFVEVDTIYGWVKLSSLGYGYQITISWLADLAKRMFDRYPDLENPLHGPAIVLVDEIDLHIHPEWQRKIIKYLSDLFPNTQFIVTAHSPLIVQSAENVNLVMLEKDEATGSINIRQQFGSFQGWTVEEILRELMDLGEKTRSDRYLELMREFEDSLLEENYAGAKTAYEELDKILSPSSHQRKVLQIQMSSLIPV
ncbi:AAA family ATPase [Larkinella sp. C7]|uniref:AAA family ATPase n=1 Tax=Larkinella sp. C7 TaxID=2576607 RepID=UPI0011115947|nr:AAA family ATPase [Larkinella sp. C7]